MQLLSGSGGLGAFMLLEHVLLCCFSGSSSSGLGVGSFFSGFPGFPTHVVAFFSCLGEGGDRVLLKARLLA